MKNEYHTVNSVYNLRTTHETLSHQLGILCLVFCWRHEGAVMPCQEKKRSFAMVLPRSVMLVNIKRAGEKFDQLWKCCGKTYQNGKLRFQKIADTKTEPYSNVTSIRWIAFTCFICMSQHCCTKSGSPGRSAQMCYASKIPKSREMCHQVCILKTFKIYHNCRTNVFHASHTVTPSLWNIEFD